MELYDLFPTPLGIFNNEDISIEEHNFLLNLPYEMHQIYNDMCVSKNKNLLNDLKDSIPKTYNFIKNSLEEYSVVYTSTTAKLKFTQSWCTKHQNIPQKTFPHRHQNSIISGTYYVNANQNDAGIKFHKDDELSQKYIKWEQDSEIVKQNKYAWSQIQFPVQTGILILFPSYVLHEVDGRSNSNTRCSLAFNTWFEESIGDKELFTLL